MRLFHRRLHAIHHLTAGQRMPGFLDLARRLPDQYRLLHFFLDQFVKPAEIAGFVPSPGYQNHRRGDRLQCPVNRIDIRALGVIYKAYPSDKPHELQAMLHAGEIR